MNLTLISAAISAAMGFGAAWQWQSYRIDSIQLGHTNERISIQRAARAAIDRQISEFNKAQVLAASRAGVIAVERDSLAVSADGLFDAIDSSMRAARGELNACVADATTKGELLTQCSKRYSELAGRADGHVNDLKTLTGKP